MTQESKTQKFISLRSQGTRYEEISKQLKVPLETLIEWSQSHKLAIENLKSIAEEVKRCELLDRDSLRQELLNECFTAIVEELKSRNLSDVPTEKLIDQLLRFSTALKDEKPEDTRVVFQGKGNMNIMEMVEPVESWNG